MDKIPYMHQDREWDIRLNVPTTEYLEEICANITEQVSKERYRYILVSGVEIGDNPKHDCYKVQHIHIAVIAHNRMTKSSILKNWGVIEGYGYYMVPRKRELPYSGWKKHHLKEDTKIDKGCLCIMEHGELPADRQFKRENHFAVRSDNEKKMKTDDILIHMRQLMENGEENKAWELYPRNYLMYGDKIKTRLTQHLKKKFNVAQTNPHIYLFGFPGSGKTSLMKWLYPNLYKKDLQNKFFDLYNEDIHTHIMLEDLDPDNVERLSVQFLKTLCDEAGFPIDQKYKTPQLTRSTILVTSNYSLDQLINPENSTDVEGTKKALKRRFFHLRVDMLHRLLGIKLLPEYERKVLKKQGNEDASKLYMAWDYINDGPTGEPLKSIEEYQQIIRDAYYGK